MRRELAEQFNREVDNYRKNLIVLAQNCDWKGFEAKAGRLFDYVESIEFMEIERRFFRTFNLILCILILGVIGFLSIDFSLHQELLRFKYTFVATAIAASGFELFFFVDYRMFAQGRTFGYRKRRENFIRSIERDFRTYASHAERKAA